MKAALLTGLDTIEIGEVDAPVIENDTDVLVSVKAVGICGSDVHNYSSGGIGARRVVFPFILGHEAAGVVAAVGPAVTQVAVGDRIMIEPAMHCGKCDQCLAGRFNTCREIQFLSSASELQGCMCEQVIIPEHNCFKIPEHLSLEHAAVAEPLSIAIYSVNKSIPMAAETPVAILGAGPIGLCTLLAAQARGARKIYITDKIPERLALAKQLGATWVGNPNDVDVVAEVKSIERLGLPVVFECSGDAEGLDQAVELLGPGGKLVITGIPEGQRVSLNMDLLRRNEISIFNVRRQNQSVEEALQRLASGDINVDKLITHRFPLSETQAAFELVASYADGVVKAMIVNER